MKQLPDPGKSSVTSDQTIELIEETATVSKRTTTTGRVSIQSVTEAFEEMVEAELSGAQVIVDHVAIDRIVDAIPQTRTVDGVTIVPVFEEVLVVERRIRLIEELHIRHEATNETVRLPVTVRRQRAVVERQSAPSPQTTTSNEE